MFSRFILFLLHILLFTKSPSNLLILWWTLVWLVLFPNIYLSLYIYIYVNVNFESLFERLVNYTVIDDLTLGNNNDLLTGLLSPY